MPVWLSAALVWIGGQVTRHAWPAMVSAGMWLAKSRLALVFATLLGTLGLSLGTIKFAIEPMTEQLLDFANGGGGGGQYAAIAINWLGILQFDKAVTMIISAITAKYAVNAGRLYLFKRGFGAKP